MKDSHTPLTRRDFVRGTLGTAVAATTLGSGFAADGPLPGRNSRVIIVRSQDALREGNRADQAAVGRMLEEALIRLAKKSTAREAWLSLIGTTDIVGLVPTDHLNPTHEEVIDAVRGSLVAAGIPRGSIRMAQGGSEQPKACTALIALPALKAHWLTGMGTVLKNYIRFSDSPSAYHGEKNARLGEIWNLPHVKGKTKLVLVDALRPLCDKGPQPDPRYMWPYNGLIAGTDPVAVETVCLQIITKKREMLRKEPWPISPPPFCVAAADLRYGLGTSKPEEITVEHFGWEKDRLV